MKQMLRFFNLALLLALSAPVFMQASSCCQCTYDCGTESKCEKESCGTCTSMYIPRSAHSNSAYFWLPQQTTFDTDKWHGVSEIGIEYQRSFKGKDIAKALFGASTLHFQGSQVANRDANAIIADNFGLSTQFDGTITFKPRISNVNIHFQQRWQFDCFKEGLYGQLDLTFSHQKRSLFAECCDLTTANTSAVVPFPAGYMTAGTAGLISGVMTLSGFNANAFPASGLKQALSGNFVFGDMQTPWQFGKFSFNDQTANKVAGVTLILGYSFWNNDCGHLNGFFQYTPPTGTLPNATYVFSPVVGNGRHNQVGAGIDAHRQLWKNDCGHSVDAYLNGYVASMLPNCQVRSFDFKDKGCLSRYMLLKEFGSTLDVNSARFPQQTSSGLGGSFVYAQNVVNGINFATRFAKVKVDVVGDASLRLVYHRDCMDFSLGYNVYGQSRERVCILPGSPCGAIDTTKQYGFKGCTGIAFFGYQSDGTVTSTNAEPFVAINNATASASTITTCGSVDNAVSTINSGSNPDLYVDWRTNINGNEANNVPADTPIADVVIGQTSFPSKTISVADLNVNSGKAPKQITQKGFATATYTWKDCDNKPYVGFGAEVEGGSRASLKQWGLWFKAGVSY